MIGVAEAVSITGRRLTIEEEEMQRDKDGSLCQCSRTRGNGQNPAGDGWKDGLVMSENPGFRYYTYQSDHEDIGNCTLQDEVLLEYRNTPS